MPQLVPIALFGWIPVGLAMFLLMSPRRAVLTVYVAGWLFLPVFSIPFTGFPDFNKVLAVSITAMLGVIIFDPGRLLALRPRWIDLPVAIWCCIPFLTSIANDLGAYDGASVTFEHLLQWGIPWVIGRAYFGEPAGLRELAIAIFIGGLVYVPLCLYEIRMSPQLHMLLYGDHPSPFQHVVRFGGYRPLVFMGGGLPLSLWMATAALIGFVLWHTRSLRHIGPFSTGWLVALLWMTTIACKSTGAILLLVVATTIYFATTIGRTRLVFAAATFVIPLYLMTRIFMGWDGQVLIDYAEQYIDEERADSLATRLINESDLIRYRVHEAPWVGWGGWGRARLIDEATGHDRTITDSLWIIAATRNGLIGLTAFMAMLILPVALLIRHARPALMSAACMGPMVAIGLSLWIYLMDRMVNAQLNPIAIITAGALVAIPWRRIHVALAHRLGRRGVRPNGPSPDAIPQLSMTAAPKQ